MKVKTAKFISSYPKAADFTSKGLPQFAFIGRSNVGKSTLINTLCNRKDLAKTSSKPGKTRLINAFLVNDQLYFVDLPGYGFAKVSKKMRERFGTMISEYVTGNPDLACLFVLIDGSIPPQAIDLEFINWSGERGVPMVLVFTKSDKTKAVQYNRNIEDFKANLYQYWEEIPPLIKVSSKKKQDMDDVMEVVSNAMP